MEDRFIRHVELFRRMKNIERAIKEGILLRFLKECEEFDVELRRNSYKKKAGS